MNRTTLAHPGRRPSFTWLVWVGLVASCLYMFVDLAEDVVDKEGFAWDAPIALEIHHFHQPWLDFVMQAITPTGTLGAVGVALAVAIWYWRRRKRVTAVTLLVSLGGVMTLNMLLKLIFARLRPHFFSPLILETDYSFPSGHTVAAVAMSGLLAVLLWRSRHYGWALVAGSWVWLVAISRVYLGVHYPSDVLASLSIGTIWLITLFLLYDRYNKSEDQNHSVASVEKLRQLAIRYGLSPEGIERELADPDPALNR